ncbi:SGNH/GDSL hydrolase family protein [Naasia aerilata]|uniref:Hydrolase n=1 Tax=Naasia aerilata TaxID=1162966 RepID=A0ABM8GE57_9MICO|nr:SGNH/GDSL hydrolase family protein [Naasia aerilata]BDZ46584.1 hydrolase [Naasia aerilata]
MTVQHLAALGSSFAAGPGIQPLEDRVAGRSRRNYPHLLAERLGARLTDLTVSGATTATILDTPQRILLRRYPPQLAGLPVDADLVTLTAGGNDLGYISGMTTAAWGSWFRTHAQAGVRARLGNRRSSPQQAPAMPTEADVERAAAGLVRIVDAVRRRAPRAEVVLVDYLTVLGPSTVPSEQAPFATAAIAAFRATGERLAEAFATASERTGAQLVQVSALSIEHAVGSAEPWANGFSVGFGSPTPFHPNADGMRAVADAVVGHLGL